MNLEERIVNQVKETLTDGTVEKIIKEQLNKQIEDIVEDLFRCYGEGYKAIKGKISEALLPAINSYDFSNYIPKIDKILTEIVNASALRDNKRILENFKHLMDESECVITTEELFKAYCYYVSRRVDTSELDICFDDGVSYEDVHCTMDIEFENREYSVFNSGIIELRCEEDEELNFDIHIHQSKRYDKDKWNVDYSVDPCLHSLRYMDDFHVLLTRLSAAYQPLTITETSTEEWIEPEDKPEPTYE